MLARLVSLRSLVLTLVAVPLLALPAYRAYADDDDSGDKKDAKDDSGDDDDNAAPAADKDQPKVTAGGLFTIDNYAISEVERPLTITKGMIEGRLGLGIDLSTGLAFKDGGLNIDGRYGILDTLELRVGANLGLWAPDGSSTSQSLYVGIEQAIMYDLVDVRFTISLPVNPTFLFDMKLGFPVKYRFSDKIAILALDNLINFHTQSGNATPDLDVGVGGEFQALDNLAILLHVELILAQFKADAGFISIPVTLAAQFSPSNRFDLGLAFSLTNLDPAAGSLTDGRAMELFARARF